MADREEQGKSGSKAWTALRHGSALIVFLGLFLAISAYASDPGSGLVTAGWIVAGLGVIGFLVGLFASRRGREVRKK